MKAFNCLLLIFVIRVKSDICSQKSDDLNISEAFRLNSDLFLISENVVYRLKNYDFDINRTDPLSFQSLAKDQYLSELLGGVKLVFSYSSNRNKTTKIFAIFTKTSHEIKHLVGYIYQFNSDVTDIISKKEFTIDLYHHDKIDSSDDDFNLNLKALFVKFPEQNIENNIKSISSFPQNLPQVSNRLFVYYLENNTDRKCKENCHKFKRYIFKKTRVKPMEYMDIESTPLDVDWIHDNTSNKCVELKDIVDASLPLTDYQHNKDNEHGNPDTFYFIEFFGNQYSINSVSVNDRVVPKGDDLNDWIKLLNKKNGSIHSLLKCQQTTTTDTPITDTTTQSLYDTSESITTSDTQTITVTEMSSDTSNTPLIYGSTELPTLVPKAKKSGEWVIWLILIFITIISMIVIIITMFYLMFFLNPIPHKKSSQSEKKGSDLSGKTVRSSLE